jgi:hypothetical protein
MTGLPLTKYGKALPSWKVRRHTHTIDYGGARDGQDVRASSRGVGSEAGDVAGSERGRELMTTLFRASDGLEVPLVTWRSLVTAAGNIELARVRSGPFHEPEVWARVGQRFADILGIALIEETYEAAEMAGELTHALSRFRTGLVFLPAEAAVTEADDEMDIPDIEAVPEPVELPKGEDVGSSRHGGAVPHDW